MIHCPTPEQLKSQFAGLVAAPDEHSNFASHVDACPSCQARLESLLKALPLLHNPASLRADVGASVPVGTIITNPPPQPAENASLPTVAGFEVLGRLGRGGMGVVFKARHLKLNRLVALKMIRADNPSPEQRSRFQIEAQAVARLVHPNIVQIHEVAEHDGSPCLALELVEGGTLTERLNHKPMAPRQAATLLATLARAIQVAHATGVIHRDLKPANVLIATDGTPKITDFGLAKKLDESAGPTLSGQIMGTPEYMAPEQASGKPDQVGPLADVYALGAILYECLTGTPPFLGPTPFHTLARVIADAPIAPGKYAAGVPNDLETICLKCLHKEPTGRYASARELADDLDRFLADRPILARRTTWREHAWRWSRRNRVLAGLLGTVALLVLVTAVGGVVLSLSLSHALGQVSDERQNVSKVLEVSRRDGYLAEMMLLQHEYAASNINLVRQLIDRQVPHGGETDHRNFEWHFWRLRSRSERHIQQLPGDPISTVAYSPDGRFMAAGSRLGRVRVWETSDMSRWRDLVGHTQPVLALVFVGTAKLATSDDAGNIHLWDLRSGESPRFSLKQPRAVLGLTYDGQTDRLVSAGDEGKIRIWDLAARQSQKEWAGHPNKTWSVAFSPDGQRLASVSDDKTLRIWEAATGTQKASIRAPEFIVATAFHPDGTKVAFAGWDKTIQVMDIATQRILQKLVGHTNGIGSLAYSPDGRYLVSGSWDNSIRVWDANSEELHMVLHGHTGVVRQVAISPDGSQIASAGWDGSLRTWNLSPVQHRLQIHRHTQDVWDLKFSPDGKWIATGSWDKTVRIFDARDGKERHALHGHVGHVRTVVFSPDGQLLASAGREPVVRIWDVNSGKCVKELAHPGPATFTFAFGPDGKSGVAGSADGKVHFWDLDQGRIRHTYSGPRCLIPSVAYSPDGKQVLAAGDNKTMQLLAADSGELLRTIETRTNGLFKWMSRASFNRNGDQIALADSDSVVRIWNPAGELLQTLSGHPIEVRRAVFNPAGDRVATASGDTTVRIWDVESGRTLLILHPRSGGVTGLAFSPDGKRLAAGGVTGRMQVWETEEISEADLHRREAVARHGG